MIKTNNFVADLMRIPRPTRRDIQAILREVWKDGYNKGRGKFAKIKK